ncbi:MAG: cytochrome c [Saprospiraceae bacterium]|nr:cytochrome c [Saprospiraceae bacterium]
MRQLATFLVSIGVMFLISCGGGADKSADGSQTTAQAPAKEEPAVVAPNGDKIFKTYCITCHGLDGKLALNGAKDLSVSELTMEERIEQITKGKGLMTPYESILSKEEIMAVAEYTAALKKE